MTTRLPLSIMTVVMPTTTLCVLPLGIHLYITEGIEPARILICVLLSMGMVGSFSKITMFMNDVKAIQYSLGKINEELQDGEMMQGEKDHQVAGHNITFDHVTFTYSDSIGDAVLRDMNVEFEEGKHVEYAHECEGMGCDKCLKQYIEL